MNAVGERSNRRAGDQGAHFHGHADPGAQSGHKGAPGDGCGNHHFRSFGDFCENPAQREPAEQKPDGQKQDAFAQRQGNQVQLRVHEIRLERKNEDGPQILKNENAQTDPAGQRVQLELVIQELHDNGRAGKRAEQRQVKRFNASAPQGIAQQNKEAQADQNAQDKLADAGIDQFFPGGKKFGGIELQTDDEQEKDQPDLGDNFDIGRIGDELETDLRSDQGSGHQIAEDDRLTAELKDKSHCRGRQNGNADFR